MGVRSLQSFVSNRGEFFKECQLKDNRLIIDGHNLIYSLYNRCPRKNCCFGGDYVKFHKVVQDFFEALKRARIKAIVVLDGAYDDAKRKTLWQRGREQCFRAVRCCPSNQNSNIILPIFAKETFVATAKVTDGVSVVTTFFEADLQLAVIAFRLGCPVLSNDSDFFIFNVRVISIDSLLNGMERSEGEAIPCREFDRQKFLTTFSIKDHRLLQLFAVLMGNDYVNTHSFDRIFAQISMPKGKSISQRHRKMTGLLKWMSKQPSVKSAVDTLMNIIPLEHREASRKKLKRTLNMYGMEGYTVDANVDVVIETVLTEEMNKLKEFVNVKDEEHFRKFFHCEIPAEPAINILVNGGFFIQSQVECKDERSSHLFALPMVEQVIVSSLSMLKEPKGKSIRMICRNSLKLATVNIEVQELKESKDVLKVIAGSGQRLKLHDDDTKWTQLLASMKFWMKNSREPPNDVDCMAVIALSAMADLDIQEPPKDLAFVNTNFKVQTVNMYNNLQAVLFHSSRLNLLRSSPLPELPKAPFFWHGTFLYNVSYFCKNTEDLLTKISDDVGLKRLVEARYKRWAPILEPVAKIVEVPAKRTRSRHKKPVVQSVESSESQDEEEDADSYVDLGNKFALLSV